MEKSLKPVWYVCANDERSVSAYLKYQIEIASLARLALQDVGSGRLSPAEEKGLTITTSVLEDACATAFMLELTLSNLQLKKPHLDYTPVQQIELTEGEVAVLEAARGLQSNRYASGTA